MSSARVTGPSLTISTGMRAPKTPVSTETPRSRSGWQNWVERLGLFASCVGEAEPGSPLASVIRDQRELADDERGPADVQEAQVELTGVALEHAQARDSAGEALGDGFVVGLRHAQEDAEAGPDLAHDGPVGEHPSSGDSLHDDSHGRSLAHGACNASRPGGTEGA